MAPHRNYDNYFNCHGKFIIIYYIIFGIQNRCKQSINIEEKLHKSSIQCIAFKW